MNLSELQVELRHFAAERDWQPFHTPKNLTTALMVESAELAEIFQWMTPDESRLPAGPVACLIRAEFLHITSRAVRADARPA